MIKQSALVLVGVVGLMHCGPTLPIKATFVSCADKSPIGDAQVSRYGGSSVSRTHADGTWDTTSIGTGSMPVEVIAKGYAKQTVELKPGEAGNTICLKPE